MKGEEGKERDKEKGICMRKGRETETERGGGRKEADMYRNSRV